MAEMWDLYTKEKEKTGNVIERKRNVTIPKGMYHFVVEIWTVNEDGRVLITRRHPDKNFGLYWECTGGAVIKGETSLEGAVRELREETGLEVKEDELSYIGDTYGKDFILSTYRYEGAIDLEKLHLQKEEVVDAKFVTSEELGKINEEGNFVPGVWKRFCHFKEKILGEKFELKM